MKTNIAVAALVIVGLCIGCDDFLSSDQASVSTHTQKFQSASANNIINSYGDSLARITIYNSDASTVQQPHELQHYQWEVFNSDQHNLSLVKTHSNLANHEYIVQRNMSLPSHQKFALSELPTDQYYFRNLLEDATNELGIDNHSQLKHISIYKNDKGKFVYSFTLRNVQTTTSRNIQTAENNSKDSSCMSINSEDGSHTTDSNSDCSILSFFSANETIIRRITNPDTGEKFDENMSDTYLGYKIGESNITIVTTTTYQTMEGFGFMLNGASTYLMASMDEDTRKSMMDSFFETDSDGIGVSMLRVSVGASDLDTSVYTYQDSSDSSFDIHASEDSNSFLPMLQSILDKYPTDQSESKIKVIAAPWTAPTWMKGSYSYSVNSTLDAAALIQTFITSFCSNDYDPAYMSGYLEPEFYEAYAGYLLNYVDSMEENGVPVYALSIQNEPLHVYNYPSMYMSAADQTNFVNVLGTLFQKNQVTTKILIFDHNPNSHDEIDGGQSGTDYPISILSDSDANQYVYGSAFHLYGGTIDQLSDVYNAFPDKKIYFTEIWTENGSDFSDDLSWHMNNIIIGAPRNWASVVLEYNLLATPEYTIECTDNGTYMGPTLVVSDIYIDSGKLSSPGNPVIDVVNYISIFKDHIAGSCPDCLGAGTVSSDFKDIQYNVSYYLIAHLSKYVRPGSQRIRSYINENENDNEVDDVLPNVAFLSEDGDKVILVIYNNTDDEQSFNVHIGDDGFHSKLPAKSAGTYVYDLNM